MYWFNKIFYFVLVVLLFIIIACVPTTITSMKDPNYYGRTFKRILVIADFEETNTLKTFELALVDEFKLRGIYAIANHKVLPPIREYSDEERRHVYLQHNIDSYLDSPQKVISH